MIDWNEALRYAGLVKLAENVRPSGLEHEQVEAVKTAGYTLQQSIYGDDLATDINPEFGDAVTFGFIALSEETRELVVALRGTDTILEWLHDFDFLLAPSPISHGFTDDGFTAIYKSLRIGKLTPAAPFISVRDYVDGQFEAGLVDSVTICGHSLGGALATLLALDVARNGRTRTMETNVYTFASPRVGDHIFAGEYKDYVAQSFRVANNLDLVTKLPTVLPLPYEHVEERCELKPKLSDVRMTMPCMHHLTTYLHLMGQKVGSKQSALNPGCAGLIP
jgi:hypothetical protein